MKILVVSGHEDSVGASSNGFKEEVLTETLSEKVAAILKANGVDAEEADYNLYRYLLKNGVTSEIKSYDYILEIHFNAGGGTGSEVFIHSGEPKKVALELMNGLSKFYKVRGTDGVKYGNFLILNRVQKNIALLEVAFIDSKEDMTTFIKYQNEIAEGIAVSLMKGLDYEPAPPKQDKINGPYETDNSRLWFRAIAGSYLTRAEAMKEVNRLKAEGRKAWLQAVNISK